MKPIQKRREYNKGKKNNQIANEQKSERMSKIIKNTKIKE